jgi:hypothetical protein
MHINKCNKTHNQNKGQSHVIISIDASDKIQHPFMIKSLEKLRIEGMHLSRAELYAIKV